MNGRHGAIGVRVFEPRCNALPYNRSGGMRAAALEAVMECRIEDRADCILIAPVGRIDSSTVASFMESVLSAIRSGSLPAVIDMQDLTFMNSAGLRVLIIAQRDLNRRGQRLSVRSPRPAVDELLRVAGLDTLLEVAP